MMSCLQDAVNNSVPRIGKYINKLEFYRQCPPRRVKDTKMSEIENNSSVRYVMRVTPVSGIEREPWGAACILRKVNYGVYICTCYVNIDVVPDEIIWTVKWLHYLNYEPIARNSSTCH